MVSHMTMNSMDRTRRMKIMNMMMMKTVAMMTMRTTNMTRTTMEIISSFSRRSSFEAGSEQDFNLYLSLTRVSTAHFRVKDRFGSAQRL